MRSPLAILALGLLASIVTAQRAVPRVRVFAAACPAADSVFGPATGGPTVLLGIEAPGELRLGWPTTPGQWKYGSIAPRIEMAAFPQPPASPPRPAELMLTLSGDPAKKLQALPEPIGATLVLKDDTTLAILGTFPTVTGAPATGMAIAFVSFPLVGPQLARLAAAKDARLELLGERVSLPKDLRRFGRDGYRAVICGYHSAR